ncbi:MULTISPECIES: DUF4767 domain-containing protein [unclassified Streptococcus]|uniref:DUF4767 domain-containing protein n=1 Tax=unclassified Streptococcus TaxID=2608887 RepID=UPI001071E6BD|nr:DUF4767 domain-containing protein [Streptococcus sp. 19428wA2_WM07]TFU27875.1 DUF4767 domain-containing protein [Streptococcus sp. WM07]
MNSSNNQTEQSKSSSSSKADKTKTSTDTNQALWNQDKAQQLASYMVEFGDKMGQPGYRSYASEDDDDFFGAMASRSKIES